MYERSKRKEEEEGLDKREKEKENSGFSLESVCADVSDRSCRIEEAYRSSGVLLPSVEEEEEERNLQAGAREGPSLPPVLAKIPSCKDR